MLVGAVAFLDSLLSDHKPYLALECQLNWEIGAYDRPQPPVPFIAVAPLLPPASNDGFVSLTILRISATLTK